MAPRKTKATKATKASKASQAPLFPDLLPKLPGANCAHCPAGKGKLVRPESASTKARLAVVGEGPGRNELEQGRPFVGASGRLLARGLRTLGLSREDVHWTNAVPCECKERDLKAATKACSARLRLELAQSGAPVVLTVGAYGLMGAAGHTKKPAILRWRGSVIETESKTLIAPTIHPAFVMHGRSPAWAPVLELDVARVGRLLQSGFTPPELQSGRRIEIAKTESDLARLLSALAPGHVGFDVETLGLGPTQTPLVCFALSDGQLTIVVPWSSARDGLYPFWERPKAIARQVSAALSSRTTVTHNGPAFDHIVAARYGIEIRRWDDSLLASHALRAHLKKNLSHVVTLALDVGPWKELEDRTATLERLWIYNARDTLYTILTWKKLHQELREAA